MIVIRKITSFPLLLPIATLTANLFAQAPPPDASQLAQRFRPYIKTSLNGSTSEEHRPTNWEWFLSRASLVSGYVNRTDSNCAGYGTDDQWPDGTVMTTSNGTPANGPFFSTHLAALLQFAGSDLATPAGRNGYVNSYALHLDDPASKSGEPWDAVVNQGHGIYAHVQEVLDTDGTTDKRLVNIEYTVLWAYNAGTCSYHYGDLTTVVVVYDRDADLLTRITYSIHGHALESFRLALPQNIEPATLKGQDINGNPLSAQTVSLGIADADAYHHADTSTYNPSANYLYLAKDPVTLRYEHPVVFAEFDDHEFWPNPDGFFEIPVITVALSADHEGAGVSFLPAEVQMLGSADMPAPGHAPFLHFNGRFGTDPASIVLHNTWYYPNGRGNSPFPLGSGTKFTDPDPYTNLGALEWPPAHAYANQPVTGYVKPQSTSYRLNDSKLPFPDVPAALSFVPKGGTVSIQPGSYPGGLLIDHAVLLISTGPGPVTLGGH